MPGIEDFVVEQIIQDFQQSQPAPAAPAFDAAAPGSSFLRDAQYNAQFNRGTPPGAVSDPRAPMGYTIADPALRERAQVANEESARSAALGGVLERGLRDQEQRQFKVMENLKGLDPQIQSTILRRLGIDPGPIKSQIDQQKELLQFKNELDRPQQETANAIKMLLATQGGRQNAAELDLKNRQLEAENANRAQSRDIQLMRTLAVLMQSDASGQLSKTLGPILMQMMQAAGINLAPGGASTGASAGRGSGIKITRED